MAATKTPSWLSGADDDESPDYGGYKLTPTGTITTQSINRPFTMPDLTKGERVPETSQDEVALAGKG
jgi:hypothetical protein